MPRPSVDVVVPFRGGAADLKALRRRLAGLSLGDGDSVLVVDNTPAPAPAEADGVPVLHAAERSTPGYARNRGAERGSAEWLVFVDADTVPPPDLLDRFFDPPPQERTALLGGGVVDQAATRDATAVARYQHLRGSMSQEDTYRHDSPWKFPKTANAACRRSAFEQVGGFREDIRAAEDADLTFRLRDAGWGFERRDAAVVVHRSRETFAAWARQKLLHGAGGGWLAREHPGSWPPRELPGLLRWGIRTAAAGVLAAIWERDRDRAVWALFDPLDLIIWEVGRSLPNERPAPPGSRWGAVAERLS